MFHSKYFRHCVWSRNDPNLKHSSSDQAFKVLCKSGMPTHKVLPTKDETSETTVQNVFICFGRCLRFFVFYVFVKKFNLFIVVFNEFYVVIKFLSIVGNPVQYFANWRFIAIYDWRLVEYDFYYFWHGQFIFMISQWSKSCENYAKIDENFTDTSFN